MLDGDPYTLVLNKLWEILEDDADFAAAVRPGNRIKFTELNRDPIKKQVGDADLPEVRIILVSSAPHQKGSSCSVFDRVTYEIQVSSGDQRLDARHLPLRWTIFRAMSRARLHWTELASLLKWNGKRFVTEVRAVSVADGVSRTDLNRGIVGWAAIWAVEVEMTFPVAEL